MRTKVYGKRGRAPIIQFDALINSSPASTKLSTKAIREDKEVLRQRSNNARRDPFNGFTKPPAFDEVDGLLKGNIEVTEIRPDISNKTKSRPRKHQHPSRQKHEIEASILDTTSLVDELQQKLMISETAAAEDESLHLSAKCGEPRAITSSLEPTFQRRSANLDAETALYVSPLLACKAVSGRVESFKAWTDERMPVLEIRKIGEGSFGEVYRATSSGKTAIIKIMPLNAKRGRGSRSYTSIEAAATELQVLEKMQKVPGFVEFRGGCVLIGSMPQQFVSEWNEYRASGRTVESRDPNKKGAYPQNQLWLVIEMSDAGTNLNPGQYRPPNTTINLSEIRYMSVKRTWDIFWQVVRAVAKAEIYADFEHRDLHLGNICALNTRSEKDEEDLALVARDSATPFSLDNTGVQATIIDYSLSRATIAEDRVLFFDFTRNNSLLRGQGDLQYDVYRYMAEAVGKGSCKEFVPVTNVMWLSHLIAKLLQVTHELSGDARYEEEDSVTGTAKMRAILEEVESILVLANWRKWEVKSAGNLLDLGFRKGWFCVEDAINS